MPLSSLPSLPGRRRDAMARPLAGRAGRRREHHGGGVFTPSDAALTDARTFARIAPVMKVLRLLLFAPLLVFAYQVLRYYPELPERVASHFDGAGNPNGWSSKSSFCTSFAVLQGFLCVFFLGLTVGIRRVPTALINLPRKSYWLAPERRESTFDFLGRQLLSFALVTQLFFVAIFHLVIRANLPGAEQGVEAAQAMGEPFWILLVGYLGFTSLWTLWFLLRFLRKPAAD